MTTKNRPLAAERAANMCWATGMRQKAIMFVDGDMKGYDQIKIPDNFEMVKGSDVSDKGNLAGSKQYIFNKYPDEKVYGWMADDNIPVTQNWSYIVERLAHPWHLVHCRDEFVSEMDAGNKDLLYRTKNLGGGICWGGDLMRSVGSWAPPGVVQAGVDWFWTLLVGDTPMGLYLHNVTVRHDNWRTGRREQDANDLTIIEGSKPAYVKEDLKFLTGYFKSDGFLKTKERILREYNSYVTGAA